MIPEKMLNERLIVYNNKYIKIPDNDFILILRKPHSRDMLHRSTCISFDTFDIMLKNAGTEIKSNFKKDSKFVKHYPHYHIKSTDKVILQEYDNRKCSKCLKDIDFSTL